MSQNGYFHFPFCLLDRSPEQSADRPQPEMILTQADFDEAMNGFTPASIRNVPLHQAGDLGWDDVGGLTDIKNTLKETLMWPSKVNLDFLCHFSWFLLSNEYMYLRILCHFHCSNFLVLFYFFYFLMKIYEA